MIKKALPVIIDMIIEMLGNDNMEVREKAVNMWEKIQTKNFHHSTEGYRIEDEQKRQLLTHIQKMAGGKSNGATDDPYGAAIRAG